MAQGYFEVELAIRDAGAGEVAIGAPDVLDQLDWSFVLVDESRGRALVKVEASARQLSKLAKDAALHPLDLKDLGTAARTYPTPRLKQVREEQVADGGTGQPPEGELRTLQTVRVGFHLVDVPVDPGPVGAAGGAT